MEHHYYYISTFSLIDPQNNPRRHAIAIISNLDNALVFDDNFGFFYIPFQELNEFLPQLRQLYFCSSEVYFYSLY